MSIPKIIHYCWFGRGEKSELIEKCIASWKEKLPDYEIREWNEDNFNIDKYQYAREAYEDKKYAFVSDVARFHILYNHGGIYMDTDVEVLKSLDEFLDNAMFAGYERSGLINSGLVLGCEKGALVAKYMLQYYAKHPFRLKNGRPNMTTVCTIMTEILKKKEIIVDGQITDDKLIKVYPTEYFDPYDFEHDEMHISENTYTIHYYAMSWKSKGDIAVYRIGRGIKKVVGPKLYGKLARAKHSLLG